MSSKPSDPYLNDPRSDSSKNRDLISRGDYTPTPIGKAVFVGLRFLDPVLQYSILAHGLGTTLFTRFGLKALRPGLPAHTGIAPLDNLHLSPYRLALLGMTIGSALKQNIWVLYISGEPMPVGAAVAVSLYNTFWNGLNNTLFQLDPTSASLSSPVFPQLPLLVGGTLYTVGILTELVSEIQRKRFKADPKNKGKPYTGGLWQLARHINYGAYVLWRGGYALAAGGWVYGTLAAAFFFTDFAVRGVPVLNEYCEKRYGTDWEEFKRRVRWRLIPGIY